MAAKRSGRDKGPEWLPDHLWNEVRALRKIPARERGGRVVGLVLRAASEGCVGDEAEILQLAGLKGRHQQYAETQIEEYRTEIEQAKTRQRRPPIPRAAPDSLDGRWPWALGRRYARFLGPEGILAGFERRNDHLVQVGEIVRYLSLPPLSLDQAVVLEHLRQAVLHEEPGFERHGPRGKIAQLINLDDFDRAPVAQYSLRLTYLEFEFFDRKLLLWLPRSVLAQFLKARGLPLPAWLARSVLIEGKASSAMLRQAALPAPVDETAAVFPQLAPPNGSAEDDNTSSEAPGELDRDAAYVAHRDAFIDEHQRYPDRYEDRDWGKTQNPILEHTDIAQLRRRNLPHKVLVGGRGTNMLRKPEKK